MLGNKDMKIKYLNPNTLFVASGLPDGVPLASGAPEPQLRAELLDTVTGRVLASFVHKARSKGIGPGHRTRAQPLKPCLTHICGAQLQVTCSMRPCPWRPALVLCARRTLTSCVLAYCIVRAFLRFTWDV